MRKAYANNLLAVEEWLELYERDRKEEEALEKTLHMRLSVEKHSQSTKKPQLVLTGRLTDAGKYLNFRMLRSLSGLSAALSLETTSLLGRKNINADFISLQSPNQIISKSVCVVFLCEMLRTHRRMLGGFPMSMF